MTRPTKEELLKQLGEEIRAYAAAEGRLAAGTVPPENVPVEHFGMGSEARSIAIYNLLLGNKAEALGWFEKSAEHTLRNGGIGAGYKDGRAFAYLHILHYALMSRNATMIKTRALEAAELPPSDVPILSQLYVGGMAHTILQRDDEGLEFATKLEGLSPSSHKRLRYYPGLGKSLQGIPTANRALLLNGISTILERHRHVAPGMGRMPDGLVCIPATALLLIAKDRGMNIYKEYPTKYIPALLFEG